MHRKFLFLFTFLSLNFFKASFGQSELDLNVGVGKDEMIKREIIIPIDESTLTTTSCLDIIEWKGEKYLGYLNHSENSFQLYNLTSTQLEKEISLGHLGDLLGVSWINEDSILVTSTQSRTSDNKINLVDADGMLKNSYEFQSKLPQLNGEKNLVRIVNDGLRKGIKTDENSSAIYLSNYGIINSTPNDKSNRFLKTKQNLEYKLDLKSGKWIPLAVDVPLSLKAVDGNVTYKDNSRAFDGEFFVYSWEKDHALYIMHKDSLRIHQTKNAPKSQFVEENIAEPYKGNFYDRESAIRHGWSHSRYLWIAYDEFKEIFYRMVLHRVNPDSLHSLKANQYYERPSSIMIFDKNLKLVKEVKLPPRTFNPLEYFITEEGLFLSIHHLNNYRQNKTLKFGLIDLDD